MYPDTKGGMQEKTQEKKVRGRELLYARGWDSGMVNIHWPELMPGSSFYLSDVRRIERRKKVKEDRGRVKLGLTSAYSAGDLKARGWSRAMIKSLLGAPDAKVDLGYKRVMHLYRAAVVEAVEASEGFTESQAKVKHRSETGRKTAQARSKETLQAAKKLAEKLHFLVGTPTSWEELKHDALNHQLARSDYCYSVDGADDETVQRWCENFLRHECSNYEELLIDAAIEHRRQPGAREVYGQIIRPAVDQMVDVYINELKELDVRGTGGGQSC